MDWDAVIERNREALRRILASLVAMAGFTSPLAGFEAGLRRRRKVVVPVARQQAEKAGTLPEAAGTRQEDGSARRGEAEASAEPGEGEYSARPRPEARAEGEPRRALPRHLHRAVLRLLRPAEAAARRLVIFAARNVVLPPPAQPRPRKPKPDRKTGQAALRSLGIAIVIPHPEVRGESRASKDARADRPLLLPLLDPLRLPRPRRRPVPPRSAPRILSFDGAAPHRLPPPPAPDDPVDATRLGQRLAALASALDDLPKQARRFARWKAARARPGATPNPPLPSGGGGPPKAVEGARNCAFRISPLRPGRPPGGRPVKARRPAHEVHEVLVDLHHFALQALQRPDTS
jgi:hypothetical protein